MSTVIVLHAALPGHFGATLDSTLLPQLAYARRLQLERCDAGARLASLAAIDLLLQGAVRLGAGPLDPGRISFPDGGKPYVAGGPRFSISHCATRVAVALSACCELGLDVEGDAGLPEGRGSKRSRLERWIATEAALKAVGEGLRSAGRVALAPDLATAQVGNVTVQLRSLSLGQGVVARLATIGPVAWLSVEEVSPAQPGLRPAAP
jgi:phosphopantetheinyl transferase